MRMHDQSLEHVAVPCTDRHPARGLDRLERHQCRRARNRAPDRAHVFCEPRVLHHDVLRRQSASEAAANAQQKEHQIAQKPEARLSIELPRGEESCADPDGDHEHAR